MLPPAALGVPASLQGISSQSTGCLQADPKLHLLTAGLVGAGPLPGTLPAGLCLSILFLSPKSCARQPHRTLRGLLTADTFRRFGGLRGLKRCRVCVGPANLSYESIAFLGLNPQDRSSLSSPHPAAPALLHFRSQMQLRTEGSGKSNPDTRPRRDRPAVASEPGPLLPACLHELCLAVQSPNAHPESHVFFSLEYCEKVVPSM